MSILTEAQENLWEAFHACRSEAVTVRLHDALAACPQLLAGRTIREGTVRVDLPRAELWGALQAMTREEA